MNKVNCATKCEVKGVRLCAQYKTKQLSDPVAVALLWHKKVYILEPHKVPSPLQATQAFVVATWHPPQSQMRMIAHH